MNQLDPLNTILALILFLNALYLFIAFILSYKKIKSFHITALDHLQLSWLTLTIFWFGLGFCTLYQPFSQIDTLTLLNVIVLWISPFILQIFNFYLNLFSNRLKLFETYFPTFIGLIWGITFSALYSSNTELKSIILISVPVVSLLFFLYCIMTYFRLLKMKNKLEESNAMNEKQFLTYIQMIMVFSIVGGGFEVFFSPAIIFSEFFSLILIIGFGLLSFFSFFFIFLILKLIKLLPVIDLSLIINELN